MTKQIRTFRIVGVERDHTGHEITVVTGGICGEAIVKTIVCTRLNCSHETNAV